MNCFCKNIPWFATIAGNFDPNGVEIIGLNDNEWIKSLGDAYVLEDEAPDIPRLVWEKKVDM